MTQVTNEGVQLADGSFISSELVVWAAGVKAPDVLRDLGGLEVNPINQLVVEPTLRVAAAPTESSNSPLATTIPNLFRRVFVI